MPTNNAYPNPLRLSEFHRYTIFEFAATPLNVRYFCFLFSLSAPSNELPASLSFAFSVFYLDFFDVAMNSSCPGSFVLSGRALVRNPRPVPTKPRTVVLDVSFLAPPDREMAEFACSLRYFKGEEGVVIADGLYDVVAAVSLSPACTVGLRLDFHIPFQKVVAFRPDVNVPSNIISEHQFKLMGDISEAGLYFYYRLRV